MLESTWDRIAALRLRRQHLLAPAPRDDFLDVVRDLVAVQAQVMSCAELSLRARVDGISREDVRRALWTDRTLVKTWAMRGTLHLVAAKELPELVTALGNRVDYLRPVWLRRFGVSAGQMRRLQDAIGDVLTGVPMTRAALARALEDRLGDPALAHKVTGSWGTLLKPVAGRGGLCFGPDDGRQVTFVRPSAWLGREMPPPDEAAIAAVIDLHLAAFPGSSRNELARWWGVSAADLRAPLAALGDGVTVVDVEGTKGFVRTTDLDELAAAEPDTGLRLLGGFDPYTLSLERAAEPLLPRARRALVTRQAGWISAVLIDGGRVTGTWTHELKPRAVTVRLVPWRRLARAELAAVEAQASRIAGFLAPDRPFAMTVADPVGR